MGRKNELKINFRTYPEEKQRIQERAEAEGINESQVMRRALKLYFRTPVLFIPNPDLDADPELDPAPPPNVNMV